MQKPNRKNQLEDDSTPDEETTTKLLAKNPDIKKAPRIPITHQKLQEVLKNQTVKVKMVGRGSIGGSLKMSKLVVQQNSSVGCLSMVNGSSLKYDKSRI